MNDYVTYGEVNSTLQRYHSQYLLLLLVENVEDVNVRKHGLTTVAYKVQENLMQKEGPLDQQLSNWAGDRPSTVEYRRWVLDRDDAKTLTRIGVVYLPQIRIMKRGQNLFRSSVAIADNGEFLSLDVGGKSFRRINEPQNGLYPLFDTLTATVDLGKKT